MNFYEYARTQMAHGINNYTKDMQVMSEEDFVKGRGKARSISSYTYELIVINNRSIKRFKGEQPDPWPFGDDEWAVWPGEVTKADVISKFEASCNELLAAYDAMGEEKAMADMPMGEGPPSSGVKVALFVFMHMMYHAAQMNYVQQMDGDMEVHWH